MALSLINRAGGHEREQVRIARTISQLGFVRDQDISLAIFGFGLRRVQPPGVYSDLEQRLAHQVPVIFAGLGIGRVIHRHSLLVIRKMRHFSAIDEKPALVHI